MVAAPKLVIRSAGCSSSRLGHPHTITVTIENQGFVDSVTPLRLILLRNSYFNRTAVRVGLIAAFSSVVITIPASVAGQVTNFPPSQQRNPPLKL